MLKSELVERLTIQCQTLSREQVKAAVDRLLDQMSETLAQGDRIEIRGFGSFSRRCCPARPGRNPRTGESISIPEKHSVHFKPGLDMRFRVNNGKT